MRWIAKLAGAVGLTVFAACGACGDKLGADGRHFPCKMGCIEKDINQRDQHLPGGCACSKSCPCWSAPPKPEK
jgi:hypothetical protein